MACNEDKLSQPWAIFWVGWATITIHLNKKPLSYVEQSR